MGLGFGLGLGLGLALTRTLTLAGAAARGKRAELEPDLPLLGPCVGGSWGRADATDRRGGCDEGSTEGSCIRRGAYCQAGHEGPLCRSCVREGTFYDEGTQQCEVRSSLAPTLRPNPNPNPPA